MNKNSFLLKRNPTLYRLLIVDLVFFIFTKSKYLQLIGCLYWLRKTNLHLKVGRSGLRAKLNVIKSQIKKNKNLCTELSICKTEFEGNISFENN